ncbi:MAG TPA: acyl-CoA thioesterase domain-containing protein [Acidimicrobiales bacterium]
MTAAPPDLASLLALQPHGPDTYVAVGPRYPWGGLYGGQIVAQGLRAAAATVDPQFRVHSTHAYFIRRGDHDEPIRFEVDRVRNGRSFVTRNVVARQATGAILSMSASFQVDEDAPEVQTVVMPEVPAADDLTDDSWSRLFQRRKIEMADAPGRARGWLRSRHDLGNDPVVQACALAFLSDDFPTDAVVAQQPDRPGPDTPPMDMPFMAFSLDHAIWFHRPMRADEWHLHDFRCHGIISSRGLSVGHVFTTTGVHVATINQEVLLRRRRD